MADGPRGHTGRQGFLERIGARIAGRSDAEAHFGRRAGRHDLPVCPVRTGPVDTIQADRIDRVFTVRDKTARELDDEKEAAAVRQANTPANRALVLYAAEQAGKDITDPAVVTAELQRAKEIFKTQL